MNDKEFKDISEKMALIGKTLEKLPPEVRPQAFSYLVEYLGVKKTPVLKKISEKDNFDTAADESDDEDLGQFMKQHGQTSDKLSDNAQHVAAFHYKMYGSEPFTVKDLQILADDAGLELPDRLDMTITAAKVAKKNLFTKAARGQFKTNAHGGTFFQDKYGIKKGKRKKSEASA